MRNRLYAVFVIAMVSQICWISIASAEDTEHVRVVPKETDEI